jgi:drug/metabolite transporter (DMT)-like permease
LTTAAPATAEPSTPAAVPAPSRLGTGLALSLVSAVLFSGKAIIIKLAYRHGVDAVTLLMYRMLFALPLFVALAWWAGRDKPKLTGREWRMVLLLGFCGYYLASFLDFLGLQYISAGLERLILYLNPTLVLLLGVLFFKQRVKPLQLLALAVSYAGVLLVFGQEVRTVGPHVALGAGLVLGSALSYAVYLQLSASEVQRMGSLRLTGWASTVACVLCLLQFLAVRPLAAAAVAPEVITLSMLNASLCTVAPILLVMMALERVGAALTAQASMVGPFSTLVLGVAFLGEPLTVVVVAGTALVLLGVALLARWR